MPNLGRITSEPFWPCEFTGNSFQFRFPAFKNKSQYLGRNKYIEEKNKTCKRKSALFWERKPKTNEPEWVRRWIFKFSDLANFFWHSSHSNGLKFVWTRIWLISLYLALKACKGEPRLQFFQWQTCSETSKLPTWSVLTCSLNSSIHSHRLLHVWPKFWSTN